MQPRRYRYICEPPPNISYNEKILTLLIIITMAATAAMAQTVQPVKWRISVKMTSKTEGVVTIRAIVGQGWHLYGLDIPKGGPKPTSFNFSKSEGIELAGGIAPSVKPEARQDAAFGMELFPMVLKRKFHTTFPSKGQWPGKIDLAIVYMACNDENCMPPKTETFSVKVPAYKP